MNTIKKQEAIDEIRRAALSTPVTLSASQVFFMLEEIEDLRAQLKDRDNAIADLEKELRGSEHD